MTSTIFKRPKYSLPKDTDRNWFTQKYERTLNLGYSITMVVVGKRTGISKTYCTARMAECLDPKGFTSKDVEEGKYTFYAKDFIHQVSTADFYRWILFDEPGRKDSGGNKQEWQSDLNRALSSTCQISRFKVPVTPFILPHRNYLASQILALANLLVVFNERGKAKVYRIEVSEFDGNIYTPYEGSLSFGYPSRDLIEAIEQKKEEMFNRDTARWTKGIERAEQYSKTAVEIAEEILAQPDLSPYLKEKNNVKVADVGAIMRNYKIGKAKAYDVKPIIDNEIKQRNVTD